MSKGELDDAIRRALNILDTWNDVAGVVHKHTGSYYELQSVIEDAVHCGAQAATGDYKKLEAENG
jgi:Tat protein secretion system quality control protein TatD with DNase activity